MPDGTSNKCAHCGARIPHPRPLNCAYCGTILDGSPGSPPAAGRPGNRFDELERHPEFPALMAHAPVARKRRGSLFFRVLFIGIFAIAAIEVFGLWDALGGPLAEMEREEMLPALVGGFIVLAIFRGVVTSNKGRRSALEKLPAVVVGERVDGTRRDSDDDGGALRVHYLTLENRHGEQRELRAPSVVTGRVQEGDLGVAYVRGDILVDFKRVNA